MGKIQIFSDDVTRFDIMVKRLSIEKKPLPANTLLQGIESYRNELSNLLRDENGMLSEQNQQSVMHNCKQLSAVALALRANISSTGKTYRASDGDPSSLSNNEWSLFKTDFDKQFTGAHFVTQIKVINP